MRLEDVVPVVISILLVGILLGVGLYVLSEVGDNLANIAGSVTNETGLWINNTPSYVDQYTASGFNTFAITSCFGNATSKGTVTVANYSLASGNWTTNSLGYITNATSTVYDDVKCSYTYLYGLDAYEAVDTTGEGVGDFAGWIAVIVVVFAAAIVLGIVLKSFGRKTPGV